MSISGAYVNSLTNPFSAFDATKDKKTPGLSGGPSTLAASKIQSETKRKTNLSLKKDGGFKTNSQESVLWRDAKLNKSSHSPSCGHMTSESLSELGKEKTFKEIDTGEHRSLNEEMKPANSEMDPSKLVFAGNRINLIHSVLQTAPDVSSLNLRVQHEAYKPTARRQKSMVDSENPVVPLGSDLIETSNDIEFEVEKILNHSHTDSNWLFFVKWKGYPEEQATWEPEINLKNCEQLVQDYLFAYTASLDQKSRIELSKPGRNHDDSGEDAASKRPTKRLTRLGRLFRSSSQKPSVDSSHSFNEDQFQPESQAEIVSGSAQKNGAAAVAVEPEKMVVEERDPSLQNIQESTDFEKNSSPDRQITYNQDFTRGQKKSRPANDGNAASDTSLKGTERPSSLEGLNVSEVDDAHCLDLKMIEKSVDSKVNGKPRTRQPSVDGSRVSAVKKTLRNVSPEPLRKRSRRSTASFSEGVSGDKERSFDQIASSASPQKEEDDDELTLSESNNSVTQRKRSESSAFSKKKNKKAKTKKGSPHSTSPEVFVVEKILKHRKVSGQSQYFVKWMNYPVEEATWELLENLIDGCYLMLLEFHQEHDLGPLPLSDDLKQKAQKLNEEIVLWRENEEFVVEQIVDSKVENGKVLYLVKWVDYPPVYNTWEPDENLQTCQELIQEFLGKGSNRSDAQEASTVRRHRRNVFKKPKHPEKTTKSQGSVRSSLKQKAYPPTRSGTRSSSRLMELKSTSMKRSIVKDESADSEEMGSLSDRRSKELKNYIDEVIERCSSPGCSRVALTEDEVHNKLCSEHLASQRVSQTKCHVRTCKKPAKFGYPGRAPESCLLHRARNMINLNPLSRITSIERSEPLGPAISSKPSQETSSPLTDHLLEEEGRMHDVEVIDD